jgi:PAS domain S-box-containing protein
MKTSSFVAYMRTWLADLPIEDPINRRLASFLQITLIGLIVAFISAAIANVIFFTDSPFSWQVIVARGLIACLIVGAPLFLLRRGFFGISVSVLILLLLFVETFTITSIGLRSQAETLAFFTLAILLGGLLMGRKSMIATFAFSASVVLFNVVREPDTALKLDNLSVAGNFILLNGLMGLFLDQFGLTLRLALNSARASETQYRLLFEESPTGIQILDMDESGYRIAAINSAGCKTLGYPQEELIGMNVSRLIEPDDLARQSAPSFEEMRSGNTIRRERNVLRKDGTHISVLGSFKQMPDGRFLYIFQDITERKGTEAALQHYAERLELLHEIDSSLLSAGSSKQIAQRALNRIRQLIHCKRASVSLFDFNKNHFFLLWADFDEGQMPSDTPLPLEDFGLDVIEALQQDEPLFINDVFQDHNATDLDKRLASEHGIHSWLSLPLLYQGQLIGSLNLGRPAGNPFTIEDAEIVREVANQLAIAVQQNRLLETTRRQLLELSVLHAVALAGVNASSEEALLESVIELIDDILYPDNFSILLLDESAQVLRAGARRGVPEEVRYAVIPLTLGIVSAVARSGQPRRVPDIRQNPDYYALIPDIQSELCVPIKSGDRVLGVINVEGKKLNAFSDADERLLTTVAGQLATALDHLRAEVALRESNERFHQMADNIQEVFWIGDSGSNENIYTSPAYEKIWGLSKDTVSKLDEFYKVVVPEDLPLLQKGIDLQKQGVFTELEYRIKLADGSMRWVWERAFPFLDENGKTTRVAGVATDITERKRAETALRESEAVYRRAIEVAGAVPYRQSYDENGQIIYDFMGEGIREITGYGPEEFTDDLWGVLTQERHLLEDLSPYSLDEAIERVRSGPPPFGNANTISGHATGKCAGFLKPLWNCAMKTGSRMARLVCIRTFLRANMQKKKSNNSTPSWKIRSKNAPPN